MRIPAESCCGSHYVVQSKSGSAAVARNARLLCVFPAFQSELSRTGQVSTREDIWLDPSRYEPTRNRWQIKIRPCFPNTWLALFRFLVTSSSQKERSYFEISKSLETDIMNEDEGVGIVGDALVLPHKISEAHLIFTAW